MLALNGERAFVLRDALNSLPEDYYAADTAEGLWREIDALGALLVADTEEVLKSMGIGRWEGRPQG